MLKKASGVLAMVIAMSASGFAAAADKVTYQLDWLPGGDRSTPVSSKASSPTKGWKSPLPVVAAPLMPSPRSPPARLTSAAPISAP